MMIEIPQKDLFRADEIALILGVSRKTVYSWVEQGKLEALRIGGKLLRIKRASIFKIIQDAE